MYRHIHIDIGMWLCLCMYVYIIHTEFMYAYVSVYNIYRFICVHHALNMYTCTYVCMCVVVIFVLFCTLVFSFNDETLWMSSVSDY